MNELVKKIAQLCQKHGWTIATVESCTGGMIASSLTLQSGASQWYMGGIVVYTREAKMLLGGLDKKYAHDDLVTEACVLDMMKGEVRELETDFVLATTGVLEGEVEGQPACTVWMGLAYRGNFGTQYFQIPDHGRAENARLTTEHILQWLYDTMLQIEEQ